MVVPTKKIGDYYIMEIFHGPTFAFKDVALQVWMCIYVRVRVRACMHACMRVRHTHTHAHTHKHTTHTHTHTHTHTLTQALGNLFEYFLKRSGKRITVVGATSGDTGR